MQANLIFLAAAMLMNGAGFDTDPNQVLADITKARSEASTKARAEGKALDAAALNAEMKAKAEDALADLNSSSAKPSDCYAWAQLAGIAGKDKSMITDLIDRYLTSSEPEAQKFNARSYGMRFATPEKGLSYAKAMVPTTDNMKLSKASMVVNFLGDHLVNLMGTDEALAFLDTLVAELPSAPAETLVAATKSIKSMCMEQKVDILVAGGRKSDALKLLDDQIAAAAGDAAATRSLGAKRTQLSLTGAPAPDFTATHTINGEFKGLASLKGKVVIVDFFAHWCGPCINSFPEMRRMYADLHDQGLEVVHVTRFYGYYGAEQNLTPEAEFDKCKEFAKKHELPWTIVHVDPKVFTEYGVTGIPTVALVDENGNIEKFKVGYSPESFAEFRSHIEAMLAEMNAKKN